MKRKVVILTVLGCALLSTGAVADPAYRASDVIAHFNRTKGDLGASRGLCIGTESECAKAAAPKAPATGFDMRVQFEYKSDVLTSSARENLDEFAKAATQDPRLLASGFVVEGHTDGRGSDSYNLDLSVRRAQSVVKYLMAHGIPADRLDAKGFGKQRLLVADPMSEANRRVETRLRTE